MSGLLAQAGFFNCQAMKHISDSLRFWRPPGDSSIGEGSGQSGLVRTVNGLTRLSGRSPSNQKESSILKRYRASRNSRRLFSLRRSKICRACRRVFFAKCLILDRLFEVGIFLPTVGQIYLFHPGL